jgi:hydroxyacylglutathione hydrolase
MESQIHRIKLGINCCYLIREKGVIMIDAGVPNKAGVFSRLLANLPIRPEQIQLIILTHGDFDHVGSARDIKALTGAKIAIHEQDRDYLEQARFRWPLGVTMWGRISRFCLKPFVNREFPPTNADIVFGESDFPLNEFGINGKVLYTPGHTAGSISVLLETGEAFVGCLAHNNLPFRLRPGLPIYAEDLEKVKESWQILFARGAKMIYPAHGNPFSVDVIKRLLSERKA